MGTKQHSVDSSPGRKKRRLVGFSNHDTGVEANECISIYLVFSKDEVGSPTSFKIQPVDLNHFFEEDGKIYGFQDLKVTVWLSGISFHAFADISFKSSSDGDKGITKLKSSLMNIFAENLIWSTDEFLQKISMDCDYIKCLVSKAEILPKIDSNDCHSNSKGFVKESNVEVVRVRGSLLGNLYSRLVPLALLLIDGSNPIDITDPRWEIYLLARRSEKDTSTSFIGFAAVYRFHRYPSSMRIRLSQILIMPPYQRNGYGSHLIQVLNNVAMSEDAFDLTFEEPVDSLQHARTCIDVGRLIGSSPVQAALSLAVSRLRHEKKLEMKNRGDGFGFGPSADVIEGVRRSLKITKKQFLQCWEILLYLTLGREVGECMESYRTFLRNRVVSEVLGKESEAGKAIINTPTQFDADTSFVMCKLNNDGQSVSTGSDDQEEQLVQLVDQRMKDVMLVAEKTSRLVSCLRLS